MRRRNVRVVLLCLACVPAASGELVAVHHDLDTLHSRSAAVVRAEVGDAEPNGAGGRKAVVHTVTVLDAYKGTPAVGQRVRVGGLSAYRRGPDLTPGDDAYEPLRKGDTVYLFFDKDDGPARRPATTAPAETPRRLMSCGVYVLDRGRVYGFGQYWPEPGPGRPFVAGSLGLVTMTRVTFPGVLIETRMAFEARLRSSPERVAGLDALVNAPAGDEAKGRLLAAFRARLAMHKLEKVNQDDFVHKLVGRYAEMATPAEVDALTNGPLPAYSHGTIEHAFRNPAGRAYLLERVADLRAPDARRRRHAEILRSVGYYYRQDARNARAGDGGCDFAATLARVAVGQCDTTLLDPLLRAVVEAVDADAKAGRPLAADRDAAAKILADAFDGASAADRFAVAETLMQISPAHYRRAMPAGGPMLTLVRPGRGFDAALAGRVLQLDCRFRNRLKAASRLRVVLRPTAGGADVVLDAQTGIGDKTDTFGSGWEVTAILPDGVAGPYAVFLRCDADGRPAGDGLGFETAIPER